MLKERQSCTANSNGSVIDCELGNPLHRNAQVSTAARFSHFEYKHLYFSKKKNSKSILRRSPFILCSQRHTSLWAPKPSMPPCCWRREATFACSCHSASVDLTDVLLKWFLFYAEQVSSTLSQSMRWPKFCLSWRCRYMGRWCLVFFINTACQCLLKCCGSFPSLTSLVSRALKAAGGGGACFNLCYLIRLARPYQVSLEENLDRITGESGIKSVAEIGVPIQYEFRVRFDTSCLLSRPPSRFQAQVSVASFSNRLKISVDPSSVSPTHR